MQSIPEIQSVNPLEGLKQFSLKEKVIIITGATGVLGASFSLEAAKAGAKIVVLGRNKERAKQRVDAIKEAGGEAFFILADVLNEEQMHAAKDQVLRTWGTIDGLVNAAGGNIEGAVIQPGENLFDAKMEYTRQAVDLNLFGTVIPTHVFGRVMAEKGKGSIVNISSLAAQSAITRVLGYTMAKAAIEAYTKWMAVELGLRYGGGVRVNAIAPGVFLTEQNRNLLIDPDGQYSERTSRYISNTPYRRLGNPEELTGTLIYLLSDASGFVTGETILVDGGFNAFSGV